VGIDREKFPWLQFEFPAATSCRAKTVRDAIGHLPRPTFFTRGLTASQISFHPNHWTMNPRSPKFGNRANGKGRSFRRLKWNKPSLTVAYGNREIHVHPDGDRRLSVLEAMLLQGFPQSYRLAGSLSDQVAQVSNAVPPPLANAIASAIQEQLYGQIRALQKSLLRWFTRNSRTFPWRDTRDPFRVLIAEKLLQQTAAGANVVRVYKELLKRYPNCRSLAQSDVRSIETLIAPLGFRYRAGELVSLARSIRDKHGGSIPVTKHELIRLPGVGDYGARAVLSFAHNKNLAVVDTNVARVLTRYFALRLPPTQNPSRRRDLQRIADVLIPAGRSREFNWAILDLAAKHCRAREPACKQCPLHRSCRYSATLLTHKLLESEKRAR
jgi:endonuclease III